VSGELLIDCECAAPIALPLEAINLPDWLFSLSDGDYQRCSTQHFAAGTSRTADGKRMSINIEKIGETLLFEHYVEDISNPDHCRVVSISDFLNDRLGQATIQVTWELKVATDNQGGSTLTNRITAHTTDALEELFAQAGVSVAALRGAMHDNAAAHNAEETPLFAANIARRFNDNRPARR
jgi:hypothetical protein